MGRRITRAIAIVPPGLQRKSVTVVQFVMASTNIELSLFRVSHERQHQEEIKNQSNP